MDSWDSPPLDPPRYPEKVWLVIELDVDGNPTGRSIGLTAKDMSDAGKQAGYPHCHVVSCQRPMTPVEVWRMLVRDNEDGSFSWRG